MRACIAHQPFDGSNDFFNNRFEDGSYGIYLNGPSSSGVGGFEIWDNDFDENYYMAMRSLIY